MKIPGCQYGIGEMVVIHGQIATALEWRYDTSIGKMSYRCRFEDGSLGIFSEDQLSSVTARPRAWPRYFTDCRHESTTKCTLACAKGCGGGTVYLSYCLAHWHCDRCGAIKCHSLWWRHRDLKRLAGIGSG